MSTSSAAPTLPCPVCGTLGTGRFCAECGAVLQGAVCPACRSLLAPGARFCHRCGAAVGAVVGSAAPASAATATAPNYLPWTLAGLVTVALLVILLAQRASTPTASDSTPVAGTAPFAGGSGVVSAPDISSMSPRERATRLFNRIMQAASEGKQDSVAFFAPMAMAVYESLGTLDADARFDLGRIAEVSGNLDVAAAQADTILQASPNHLLGLILAGRVADARGDKARRDLLERRLLAAAPAETTKSLPEYAAHKNDIDAAVAAAKARLP